MMGRKVVNTEQTGLNMRSSASATAKVLSVIPRGTTVTVTGKTENNFTEVIYLGKNGYCSTEYLGDKLTRGTGTGGSNNKTPITPTEDDSTLKTSSMTDKTKKILKWTGIAAAAGVVGYMVYKYTTKGKKKQSALSGFSSRRRKRISRKPFKTLRLK